MAFRMCKADWQLNSSFSLTGFFFHRKTTNYLLELFITWSFHFYPMIRRTILIWHVRCSRTMQLLNFHILFENCEKKIFDCLVFT